MDLILKKVCLIVLETWKPTIILKYNIYNSIFYIFINNTSIYNSTCNIRLVCIYTHSSSACKILAYIFLGILL